MAAIDGDRLRAASDRYPEHAVFARVEDDRLETLPEAFRDGTYLWKDVEWVVRWYCRRPLTEHDRSAESAFRENDMGAIRNAIDELGEAAGLDERLETLTGLAGVDVPIASAFLQFVDPDSFTAIDSHAWGTLRRQEALNDRYPDPVRPDDYDRFVRECHGIAATVNMRVVDVGHGLWVLGVERASTAGRHR